VFLAGGRRDRAGDEEAAREPPNPSCGRGGTGERHGPHGGILPKRSPQLTGIPD
jgi:hypothetical protein